MTYKIPPQPATTLDAVFAEDESSPFDAIDSNLAAWLHHELPETGEASFTYTELSEHKDNAELIDAFGGEQTVLEQHTLTPQQICYLVENDYMQTNGLANLFFVYSEKEQRLFIVNVVWDEMVSKFVPYIYRTRNRYRAWTRGNRLFLRGS